MTAEVLGSTFSPPNVNVIPVVILTARNGAFTIGNAQFVLFNCSPPSELRVDSPSFTEGSNLMFGFSFRCAATASLYS